LPESNYEAGYCPSIRPPNKVKSPEISLGASRLGRN
jgi:hypothetical protein